MDFSRLTNIFIINEYILINRMTIITHYTLYIYAHALRYKEIYLISQNIVLFQLKISIVPKYVLSNYVITLQSELFNNLHN